MSRETKYTPDKFWRERSYPLSHIDALDTLTKQELVMLGQRMLLSILSKFKKEELVHCIAEKYADNIWPITRVWDRNRMKLMKQIANNGGIWEKPSLELQQYAYFSENGMLFPCTLEGRHVVLMPAELVQMFNDLEFGDSNSLMERSTEWIRLSIGLLNYYGALTVDQLTEFVISHASNKLAQFDMFEVMVDASFYYDEITVNAEALFYDSRVIDVEAVINEQELRTDLDFCSFTKQELWRAGDPEYTERTPSYIKFVRFIKNCFEMDTDEAELVADLCADAAKNGRSLAEMIGIVQEFVETPDLQLMNEITGLLVVLYNDTKQWLLKGHSPNELSSIRNKVQPHGLKDLDRGTLAPVLNIHTKTKVGRNDPCPCQSGKKFKKCCGQGS